MIKITNTLAYCDKAFVNDVEKSFIPLAAVLLLHGLAQGIFILLIKLVLSVPPKGTDSFEPIQLFIIKAVLIH
jgi:hypothetical protein